MSETQRRLTPAELLAELQMEKSIPEPASTPAVDTAPPATEAADAPDAVGQTEPDQPQSPDDLSDFFNRVNSLLGEDEAVDDGQFRPLLPKTIEETGLPDSEVERLVIKCLFSMGTASGRFMCSQIRLPFPIVEPILKQLKHEQLIAFKGAAAAGDYEFTITDKGRDRGRRYVDECTYFGSAPVPVREYISSVAEQSLTKTKATETDLKRAFSDLIINENMLDRLGPAVNSGRGLFLFGMPGNGKTSIAERVTASFGTTVYIPRALIIDGEILRLYDPGLHEEVKEETSDGILDRNTTDQRWVKIKRPTVIAGGELTMSQLEVSQNPQTKICEAPLQLKSNCGTLIIDDFGRQRMPVDELLNRWIVPLEKRYDFLNMPSGKKLEVPFDQLIIFSTNLEPRDLVDGAFLRRIPYKIEVPDPSESEFRELCKIMVPIMGFEYNQDSIDYLIENHYKKAERPFRACQPRDLLLQVRNFCIYKCIPQELTPHSLDFAVDNYFAVM